MPFNLMLSIEVLLQSDIRIRQLAVQCYIVDTHAGDTFVDAMNCRCRCRLIASMCWRLFIHELLDHPLSAGRNEHKIAHCVRLVDTAHVFRFLLAGRAVACPWVTADVLL